MKLQYEILTLGLQTSIEYINELQLVEDEGEEAAREKFEDQVPEHMRNNYYMRGMYYKFATYFVDSKDNLKDIMQQLGTSSES